MLGTTTPAAATARVQEHRKSICAVNSSPRKTSNTSSCLYQQDESSNNLSSASSITTAQLLENDATEPFNMQRWLSSHTWDHAGAMLHDDAVGDVYVITIVTPMVLYLWILEG